MEKLKQKKYQMGLAVGVGTLALLGTLESRAAADPPAPVTSHVKPIGAVSKHPRSVERWQPPQKARLLAIAERQRHPAHHQSPAPAASPEQPSQPAAHGFSPALQAWLHALGQCESGNNPRTNTGNGYYGEFQFAAGTWDSLNTGYARADLAPEYVQELAIIANTRRSSGGLATQNPGCYVKEQLSAFPPQ